MGRKNKTGTNGRDSNPKYLGVKLYDGQIAKPGSIIVRQRGNKIYPGLHVAQGKDFTLCATIAGKVKFERWGKARKKVSVYSEETA
jgi:large subunit ribosomal protein L27